MPSPRRAPNLVVGGFAVTEHPRISVLARLAAMALAWASFVAANPAGAAEPDPIPTVVRATTGLRERGGIAAREAAERARLERARVREEARAAELARKKARIARKARLARIARERAAAARQRFIATHRCPVDGPGRRWLAGDWHPQPYERAVDGPDAEKRGHNGIDLFAPLGTPVRAPFDGVIRYGRSNRGGLWFKLIGNGGYAYGSHMHAFGPKRGRVKAADIIGYVGRTGNARGTHPHLHFEWHPGGGQAANPARLLRARCGAPSTSYPS
jgi:murein DD-endopeptidase MepM/ murein hydrolase activator NlpD